MLHNVSIRTKFECSIIAELQEELFVKCYINAIIIAVCVDWIREIFLRRYGNDALISSVLITVNRQIFLAMNCEVCQKRRTRAVTKQEKKVSCFVFMTIPVEKNQ